MSHYLNINTPVPREHTKNKQHHEDYQVWYKVLENQSKMFILHFMENL